MIATQTREFPSYTYGEGKTADGRVVEFTCAPDEKDLVVEFIQKHLRSIDTPTTGRVNVSHGGYGRYTRYDITQYKYAGGGHAGNGCFIEVLEIKNPSDNRWGIVVHEYSTAKGSVFTEWESLEAALKAFDDHWGKHNTAEVFQEILGFKRRVICGALSPWFYAIGDQQLLGDYAFPEGLQDDPVYCFGQQFVVCDSNGIPSVKTCMGTRFISRKTEGGMFGSQSKQREFRLVYWDDGSVWDESNQNPWWSNEKHPVPRPIKDVELWAVDAIQQFHILLAGKKTSFSIDFLDGTKFVGKIQEPKVAASCPEGDYKLIVHLKDGSKPLEGWVHGFKPTPEEPDIVKHVVNHYKKDGKEVDRIEIVGKKVKAGGKKWKGVFHCPPR